jgi:DMSO/TMAO reductase YedYZ molybdopterin-dependent catalytic subunit
MKTEKGIVVSLVILLLILSGLLTTGCTDEGDNDKEGKEGADVEWDLTVINGEQEKVYSYADVIAMASVEGWGGSISSVGEITGPFEFEGVPVADLCEAVGGVDETKSVRIIANDGYATSFSYDMLQGEFTTYDPATANEAEHGDLTLVLAFEKDGKRISDEDGGPLRTMVVSDDKLVVDGFLCIKWVKTIELRPVEEDWELKVYGEGKKTFIKEDLEEMMGSNAAEMADDDGTWSGVPLWRLIALVDGDVAEGDDDFNDTLADQGYEVNIIASDGYNKTINSSRLKRNDNIFVAVLLDGKTLPDKYWPLRLMGSDVEKSEMIRNLAKIEII